MFKLFSGYIPLFCLVYQLVCENVFLNVIDARASSIERVGNALLTPVHYVLNARVVDGERVRSRFSYVGPCALPMTGAVIALPASLVLGSVVKGLAYLSQGVRERHRALRALLWEEIPLHDPFCVAEAERYLEWPRKDEVYLPVQRGLLERIERLLGAYQIPFWVDAGSCLGVYRHNGVIPWDDDIDIAILQEDYLSVLKVLKRLGGDVWVQDWSGRDKPHSYIQIYHKATGAVVDVYVYKRVAKGIELIFSQENSLFFPESWKERERKYLVFTPNEVVFPLRKATLDGIPVFVPNQIKTYLQMRYGEDLRPVRVYDKVTGQYEKVADHPYWAGVNDH